MAVGIIGSPISEGRTVSLFDTTSAVAITEQSTFSIDANGILLGVFVTAVTGSVTVTCHTVGDDGQLKEVIAFPAITSPTTELQLRETLTVLSKLKVTVVATGAATYRVFGKAISVMTGASGGSTEVTQGTTPWIVDGSGVTQPVQLTGGLFVTIPFDTIQAAYPSAVQEVYSYKVGGLAGTLVATVTVIYTDASKAVISSVVRT